MTLTNVKRLNAFVFSVILLTSCTNTAHIEKDPAANLANYKTYSWIDDSRDSQTQSHKNDLIQANVRDAVNRELQKNGYAETKKNPDLLLTSDVLVERDMKKESSPVYSQPFSRVYFNRFTRRYGTIFYPSQFLGYDNYARPVKHGTVTITMIDRGTDKTIWQGWATEEINSSNITGKEIQKNVKSIFKKFETASK